ncbi:GNAT family N-acetyltransferase [Streptomyces sp. NPDC087659]|uniref:GNAT family N-acetyltransferase n=1 Tax=Streptomyces sp. NPDC087659 TaxID=3365801 RepID=UPI00381401C9
MTTEAAPRVVAYEHKVEGLGTMRIAAMDPDRDAALLHGWVTEERARFWGMGGMSLDAVHEIYAHMDTLTTHHAFLVHRDGEPVAVLQTYEPSEDRVSLCYQVEPGDIGMHLLVGPVAGAPEPGFTGRLIAGLVTYLFSDASRKRIVVEPDAHNERAIARFARSGFELGPEITMPAIKLPDVHLPEKVARLAFLRRRDILSE